MAVKTKKKNKFLPMIILLIVLIALFAAYKLLSGANQRAEAEEEARLAAENADIMIAEYDYTTMTELSYQLKGADELKFAVSGSSWIYLADEKFPLDVTTISYMASAIAQIAVECTVDEGSPADYGLDDPAYTINVKYSDGSSHEYKIGDYNTFNSAYYFMADGDMYMISSGLLSYFNYTLDDLLVLDTIPYSDWSDTDYVNYVTVTVGGESNKISDSTGKSEIVELIKYLPLTKCEDYYSDEEEKSAYGLDGGTSIVVNYKKAKTSTDADGNETTTYLDTGYTLLVGEKTENGYYAAPANSDITYIIDAETIDEVLAYISYVPETDEA